MNYKSSQLLFFIVLLGILHSPCFAQDTGPASSEDSIYNSLEMADSVASGDTPVDTVVQKTQFTATLDSFQHWKESADFSYMNYLDSLLRNESGLHSDTVSFDNSTGKKRVVRRNEKQPDTFLNSLPLKIFFWSLAIFFIGFIVYKLFLTENFFAKRNTRMQQEIDEEGPSGLDDYLKYNMLIDEAESRDDYNLSTRYLYLQTLKMLTDRDLISYSPEKTNYSYVKELWDKSYREDFAALTLNYEYVWYGKFAVSREQYRQLKTQFTAFNNKV